MKRYIFTLKGNKNIGKTEILKQLENNKILFKGYL
jgi:hypothetical protein